MQIANTSTTVTSTHVIESGNQITVESGVGQITVAGVVMHLQDRTITATTAAVNTGAVAFPFTLQGPLTITLGTSSLILTRERN